MYLDDKKVLLAGATGLVGRGVLTRLLADHPRLKVRAVFHREQKPFVRDRRVEYVRADLCRLPDGRRAARGCDCAIMTAAQTGGAAAALLKPWAQVTDNAVMNALFLEACHLEGVRRVVCLGSATLYQPREGLIREEDLNFNEDPHAAYFGVGWATRFVEKLCRFWHEKAGLEIVIGRCANVYGPYARFDPARSNFIPALVRKAVAGEDPFEVWGEVSVERDVVYVDDVAAAVLAMMNAADARFDIFNIGSGRAVKVGEVVDRVLASTDHAPKNIVYRADGPATIRSRVLDCAKAKNILCWSSGVSLEEGIQKTVAWWQANRRSWKK